MKGYYGREPFDLRLTVLRLADKLPVIAAVTVLGSLLFGGGYYIKNVLLRGENLYSVTSRYRVEYAVQEEKDVGTVYINQVSWNTYLQTDLVQDAVRMHLGDMAEYADGSLLSETVEAILASDLRVLTTIVTTDSPEKSLRIAEALEAALTGEFAGEIREIVGIEVIDAGSSAEEVIPDVRTARAFVLSGILSCFFAVMILLLRETGDDSIWLPNSLWRRYGLKCLGTLESRELTENMEYFFPDRDGRIAVCAAEEGINTQEVLEKLRQRCLKTAETEEKDPPMPLRNWYGVQEPVFETGVCAALREAQGIVLVTGAGRHKGRRLERVLEYLEQQDCRVTAALLWEADERLLRRYYWK